MTEDTQLLEAWESAYKKGLLSFWLLLLLHERPCYPYELGDIIRRISQSTMSADGNSIYRALSRFEDVGIVESEIRPSESGPARRYYQLTESGLSLLATFIQRNILIFQSDEIRPRIQAVLQAANPAKEN